MKARSYLGRDESVDKEIIISRGKFEVSDNVLLAVLRLRETKVKQKEKVDDDFCIDNLT